MTQFQMMPDGFVEPPIIRGRRTSSSDEVIADTIQREQAEAKAEGRRASRRSLLHAHIPGDDDEAINRRRRVERIILLRRQHVQA